MKMKRLVVLISFMAVANIAMANYNGTVKDWINYLKYTYGIELNRPAECTKLSHCYEWKWARKRKIKELRIVANSMGIVLDEGMINKYLNHRCSDCSQISNDEYNRMEIAYLNGDRSSSSSGVSNGKNRNKSSNSGMRAYRTYRSTGGGFKGYNRRRGW